MRRGSLSVRYVRCSKPGCTCAEQPEGRHGPYYSLTRGVGGRTRSKWLSPEQAEFVRRQIEAARQFRQQIEAFWEACEQWADAQIEASPAADKAVKKMPLETKAHSRAARRAAAPKGAVGRPGAAKRRPGSQQPLCAVPYKYTIRRLVIYRAES